MIELVLLLLILVYELSTNKFSDSGGSCHKKSVGQRVGKHESKANMINEF